MASPQRDEITRLELLHAAHPDGLVFPHLADAYRRAGRYAQADSLLHAGMRRHADYSSAHVVLGMLRLDQGDRAGARAAFQTVLQLDSENQVALERLGELAVEEGRVADAIEHFQRLHRVRPDPALLDRIDDLDRQLLEPAPRAAAVPAVGPGPRGASRSESPGEANGAGSPTTTGLDRAASRDDGPATAAPGAPPTVTEVSPEPGEVVTETMAELYARQGLHDRAAGVYRQLLERNPGDARLRAKLDAVAGAPAVRGPPGPADGRPAAAAPPAPAPPTGDPAIREYLGGILRWKPQPAADVAVSGTEPWAAAAVTRADAPRESAAVSDRSAAPAPAAPPSSARSGPAAPPSAAPPSAAPPSAAPPAPRPAPGAAPVATALGQTRNLIAITDLLVGLLEYRDPFFRGSSSLTRLLATSVGEEMGLTEAERVDLALAAVLRDLGRLALGGRLIPTANLSRTPESRRRIERHVELALHLLEGVEIPGPVRAAVRHHHERWDGTGYPDGLAGAGIPLAARILAVVDSFAAMVSPRPYRLPRKVPEAARELQDEAGTSYDPAVVEAMVRVLQRREQPHLGFVQRHHVVLVNRDQPGAVVTAAKLCSAGYLAEVAVDPQAARERLRRVPVAALVVSAEAGEEEMVTFIREIRSDPLFSGLPVVAVEAETVKLRVRLLESGADVCFPPGVSYAELQGTLSALVRRTLRAQAAGGDQADGADSPWLALHGDVQDFPLTWLLQVMKYDSRTAAIGLRTAQHEGAIYLRRGDAVHAQIRDGAKGEDALRQMLAWEQGRFTVQPDARPREQTIDSSIMHLLLTQAVDEDHAAAGIFGAVSAEG